jgi:hypothetical protein
MANLQYLVDWYAAQCDGDWEHEFGVRLATLDNPGWDLQVDLVETDCEGHNLARSRRDLGEGRWITTASDGVVFDAGCDPSSLDVVVLAFKAFVESVGRTEGNLVDRLDGDPLE